MTAYQRQWYQRNKERLDVKQRSYRQENKEKIAAYHRNYRIKNREAFIEKQRKDHREAAKIVARSRGDEVPRCRIDLTPDTPVSGLPCSGRLQIDHMNGRGYPETGLNPRKFYKQIVTGERNLSDLRLVCQLHQLWNTIQEVQ